MGSDYSEIYADFDYIMFRSAVKSKLVALGGRQSYQAVAKAIDDDGMIDARELARDLKLPSVAAIFNVMEADPVKAFVVSEEGNGRVLTPYRDETTKDILDMKNHDKSKGGNKKKKDNFGSSFGRQRPPQRGGHQSRTFPTSNFNGGYHSRVTNFATPKPAPPKPISYQPYQNQSKPSYGNDWGAADTKKKYYSSPIKGYVTGGNENKIFDPTAGKRKPNTTNISPATNVVSTNGNLDSRMTSTSNSKRHTSTPFTSSNGQNDSYSTAQSHSSSRQQNYAPASNRISTNQYSNSGQANSRPAANFSQPNINTQSHSSDSIKSVEVKMDRMDINLRPPPNQIIFAKAPDEVKFQLMFKHTRQYPNIGFIPLLDHFQDVNPHVMLDKYEFQNYLHENQDRLNIIIHGNGTVSPCIVNWREKCDQIFSDLKQRSLLDETPFTVRVLQHHKELQLLAKMTNKSIWSILLNIKSFQVNVTTETDDWLDFAIERNTSTSDVWGDFIEQTAKLAYTYEMDQGHLLAIGKFPLVYRHYYRQDFDFRKLHYKGVSEDILMDIDKVECTRFKKERIGKHQF